MIFIKACSERFMILKDEYYGLILKTLFISVCIFMIIYVLLSDFTEIIFRVPDDASYYLKIAENYNSGKGFSFDGIHQTNGFQPLWQYMIVALTYVFSTNHEQTMRMVLILQVILLFISGAFLYNFLKNSFTDRVLLVSCIFFIVFVFFQSVNAMETALLVFMISLILYYCNRVKIPETENLNYYFIFGILTGLLILTRLDSVFFAIPAALFLFLKKTRNKERSNNLSIFISFISGAVLIVMPYFIYNYSEFGNIIPVSGYLKSSFPEITFTDKISSLIKYRETYFAFMGVIYLIWYLNNFRSMKDYLYLSGLAVMSAGIILLMIYMIFFLNWVIFSWYFITYSLFVSLAVCLPVRFLFSKKNFRLSGIIYLIITMIVALYWGTKAFKFYLTDQKTLGGNWIIESYTAAKWVKDNSDTGDIYAMKDAGHFSYFSGRDVINLDGLVNNFDYQEVLRKKELNLYLRKNGVKYIVQHAIWNRDDINSGNYDTVSFNYISHKYSEKSDPVILKKSDEVYRSAPYYDGEYNSVFLIWRYDD